ncbi:MAG: hypothetical protein EP343_26940 [Deltaproteobacteria bacterium]|nr:MAG: hypothetical protein EP343_26940 [Deltaproteobacteria bacterium]
MKTIVGLLVVLGVCWGMMTRVWANPHAEIPQSSSKVTSKNNKGVPQAKKGQTQQGKKQTRNQDAEFHNRLRHSQAEYHGEEDPRIQLHRERKDHEHHSKDHGMVGFKMGWFSSFNDWGGGLQNSNHAAMGGFVEFVLIPHRLELEFEVEAVIDAQKLMLPIDLILKMPFLVRHSYELYIGVGAAFVPTIANFGGSTHEETTDSHKVDSHGETQQEHSTLEGGVLAVVGTKIWFNKTWGMEIEGSYHLLFDAGRPVHEMGLQTGVLARW